MQTAIVIMYPGEQPSEYIVQELVSTLILGLGNSIEDSTKLHVEVMDEKGIANACVNKYANAIDSSCPSTGQHTLPGNQAIVVIGGMFEEEIKNFKKTGALPFTAAIVRKYGNANVDNKEDAAFLSALNILSDPYVQFDQQVARKWGFTKAVHNKLIDVYSILKR